MKNVVCFAGHRLEIYNIGIEEKLKKILEELINNGYNKFLNGFKGAFDKICASEILELQKKYPSIRLVKVLTYYKADKMYENTYSCIEEAFPEIDEFHPKQKITKRNEWMVEQSDVVVCHIKNEYKSGAYNMVKYAKKLNKIIINI